MCQSFRRRQAPADEAVRGRCLSTKRVLEEAHPRPIHTEGRSPASVGPCLVTTFGQGYAEDPGLTPRSPKPTVGSTGAEALRPRSPIPEQTCGPTSVDAPRVAAIKPPGFLPSPCQRALRE